MVFCRFYKVFRFLASAPGRDLGPDPGQDLGPDPGRAGSGSGTLQNTGFLDLGPGLGQDLGPDLGPDVRIWVRIRVRRV